MVVQDHTRAVAPPVAGLPSPRPEIVEDLRVTLSRTIEGEVRFDDGDRALYAADAGNYRHVPIGVVIPRDESDVEATIAVCRAFDVPVLPRGGGTSLGGQCANVAVVVDFSRHLDRIVELDPDRRRARVQAGTVLDRLRNAAAEHGLTYGPDPATHPWCTFGGMIGNNSCGVHSMLSEFHGPGPRTEDQVLELEVLTYDGVRMRLGPTSDEEYDRIVAVGDRRGEIHRRLRELRDRYGDAIRRGFPDMPRRVSGYNLPALLPENGFDLARSLVGTEGTCVTILEATVALVPAFPARVLLLLGYPSIFEAADHVPEIRAARPIGLEGMDDRLASFIERKQIHQEGLARLPEGGGWLLVEFGGETVAEAEAGARALMSELRNRRDAPSMELHVDPAAQQAVWEVRESGLGATAFVPGEPDTWPGWEDSAVPPHRLGDYLRDLRQLFDRHGYHPSLYGHFGQGCVHTRISFDFATAKGIERYGAFTREAAELVVTRYGGSLSGEHGDGQARGDLLPIMYGDELMEAFREFQSIWDPAGRMNPGKVVDARPRTADLRVARGYHAKPVDTHFAFPRDEHSFARATMRCVGVGKCRKLEGGTMCPSFMVVRDEKHTTRGRAHLLFEMLQGDVVTDGWRDDRVRESLDLCLSCKGCKGECPVNVDIATYKAEFLSHYYAARFRPLAHYLFGNIDVLSRLASLAPGAANFVTHAPPLEALAKRAAGIASQREIPRFSRQTFRDWWNRNGERLNGTGQQVVLWADTFSNHFLPKPAAAAAEVLVDAGCRVTVPHAALCCGRPLYEFGMLGRAKRLLRNTLDELRPLIRSGVPVVGVEPSCVTVFRDELPELFPDDEDAVRLSRQVFTLAEFLERIDYQPPPLNGRAIIHGHCHEKAILDFEAAPRVLARTGLSVDILDSGCCGMAGAFGFEADKFGISMAAGERVLLPAVRKAGPGTMIIADGFSCRSQIREGTERRALHLAEVLQLALRREQIGAATPEVDLDRLRQADWTAGRARRSRRWFAGAALVGGAATLAVLGATRDSMKERRTPWRRNS